MTFAGAGKDGVAFFCLPFFVISTAFLVVRDSGANRPFQLLQTILYLAKFPFDFKLKYLIVKV